MRIVSLFFYGLLFAFLSCSSDKSKDIAAPEIKVYKTELTNVPVYKEFVGQIFGYKDIAIRARVEGFLEMINFREGSRVKQGELLYTLDSQPFKADEAAKLSRVAEAKTMLAKAQSDLNRIRPLAEQNAVSQSDLDAAIAQHEASVASVEAAEANLRASQIQLGYTRIHSPITGIIGKTQAKVGDFVGKNPNPVILNVVSRLDTILVQFFLTETQYLAIARHVALLSDSLLKRQKRASLELILADGSLYEHTGKIDFIDREVDPTTGAILVQASFPNPDRIIRPGQFGKVKAKVADLDDGILIPQRCVSELQGRHQVYVVNDSNKVELRTVKMGPKVNNFWIILEGLSENENVIYEGIQKIRSGALVRPKIIPVEQITQKFSE